MDEIIDDRLRAYNDIEDLLDSRLEQVQLLFGNDYSAQTKIYNQKIETNMGKMATLVEAIEAKKDVVKQLEKLEASNKELSSEERQQLKDARDSINDLQKQQIETETSLLQDIAAKLESETRQSMDNMIKQIFGGQDVD